MKVMLICKGNFKQVVFIDNAIAVRIERDARDLEMWVIETEEMKHIYYCRSWFIYLHYDEK